MKAHDLRCSYCDDSIEQYVGADLCESCRDEVEARDPSASFSRNYDHVDEPWRDLISLNRFVSPRDIVTMWCEGNAEERCGIDGFLDHQHNLLRETECGCPTLEARAARWRGATDYEHRGY